MSKTDFIECLLSCSPLFPFLSLYILDSFPHLGSDARREESRQQFVQSFLVRHLKAVSTEYEMWLRLRLQFPCDAARCLWWIVHLGYWSLWGCVCWVTSFSHDPIVTVPWPFRWSTAQSLATTGLKYSVLSYLRIPTNGTKEIEAKPFKPAPNREHGDSGVRILLAVGGGDLTPPVCLCVCCRWRWSRAACSVRNRDESSRSLEESPTCCWAKTRHRRRRTRPPPEPSLGWDCGYRRERERRERGWTLV